MKFYVLGALLAASSYTVAAQPVEATDDTPEEIAEDAARDLKDNRFYNKPGATRAQYDSDWQECRLIARGSRTPAGTTTLYNPALYNPAISPLAGAVGGGLGAAIGAAIVEGQQRRANRRNCLMIRGWRLVEPTTAMSAKIAAMTDSQRNAYFDSIVGADTVEGETTTLESFLPVSGLPASMAGPPAGKPTLFLGKKVPLDDPLELEPGEGAVMVVFRRNDEGSAGRSGSIELRRYDAENGDLHFQPKKWKKMGDFTTYWTNVASKDRKAPYEIQIVRLTAGDYVIGSHAVGKVMSIDTFCFGAPKFSIEEGKITYLTDLVPFIGAKQHDGEKVTGMAFARDYEQASTALSTLRPDLAGKLVDASIANGATYSCAGPNMTRMDYPLAQNEAEEIIGESVASSVDVAEHSESDLAG